MTASHRPLRLRTAANVVEFDRLAADFLRAREAEQNLILGLCSSLRGAQMLAPFTGADAGQPPSHPISRS
jgi:hypothetical protein